MTGIEQDLALLEPLLQRYGYALVFASVFLEAFGMPTPGESLVIASALIAARGDLHIVPLLAAVWAAAVAGDNVGYLIGQFGGHRLIIRYGGRIGLTERRMAKVEALFQRYGAEVVLVARFFLLLRQLNGVTAGTLEMPWHRFLLYNALGAALWTSVWGLGVYVLGHEILDKLTLALRIGYGGIAVFVVGVLALLAVRHFRRRRR